MCGRVFDRLSKAEIFDEFDIRESGPLLDRSNWPPTYNGPPTMQMNVIRWNPEAQTRQLDKFQWGLVPSWAKDDKGGAKLINARAETVAELPSFRKAFSARRCIVVIEGFYEWLRAGNSKQPYAIKRADDRPMAIAGLWEGWKRPDGTWLKTCCIITTSANEIMAEVHDRMPVILDRAHYGRWLGQEPATADDLKALLRPCPSEWLRTWRVNQTVNNVRNAGEDCLLPMSA